MANPEHLTILEQGVDVWNEWKHNLSLDFQSADDIIVAGLFSMDTAASAIYGLENSNLVDLSGADLRRAILNEADISLVDLSSADLSEAELNRADLSGSVLAGADLSWATLSGADLREGNLETVDLSSANLSKADLSGADLIQVNLSNAVLSGTILSDAICMETVFSNVDLSETTGLDTVFHQGPSSVGIDTIYASKGKIPEAFLRGAGVPENFITYMASLTGKAFEYHSAFISYSSKDEDVAGRLHDGLQGKGVRCWFAPEDMKIGAVTITEIDQAIRSHDKLLLILSETSVQSDWVEHEVVLARNKEIQQGRTVLFPVRIDDAIMDTNVQWAKTLRETRHIGDFTNWKDRDSYRVAFDRLLRDLQQSDRKD